MALSWKKAFALLSCLALPQLSLANIEYDPAWNLSEKEIKRVNAGRVVTHTSSVEEYTREVNAYLLIKSPAEQIFSIITDYEKLPEFMPNLEQVEILESTEEGALVNYMLGLPFGVEKRYRLKLSYNMEPNLKMSWNLVPWQGLKPEETIVDTSGYWLLKTTENSDETLLVYYTKTDPGDVPFGLGWIVDYLTNQTVVELLKKTKKRAEKRWLESSRD